MTETSVNILVSIVYFGSLLTFLFFSFLAVKHAAQFRYLSTRTVYLTLVFAVFTTVIFVGSLFTYFWIIG